MYKVFLNTLVATSWNAFAGDIVVKSRDAIRLHQEKYNVNSVILHNVLASDYLTDCHQALFFRQDTLLFTKKLAFDGFLSTTSSALKIIDFCCLKNLHKFFVICFGTGSTYRKKGLML